MGVKTGLFQINVVSVALLIIVAGLGYGGWKFAPVYWQAQKVDELMGAAKWEAARINLYEGDQRAQVLTNRVRDGCIELGIDERYLDVYFAPDFSSLHADYEVDVEHIVGGTTTLEFERELEIPRANIQN